MGALWNTVKWGASNLVNDDDLGRYIARAAQGAGVGAGIGGVSEWSEGGSFWGGAKSGMFTGATWGAGLRAARVASGASHWKNTAASFGAGHGLIKAGAGGIGPTTNIPGLGSGVSKQLDTIMRNDAIARINNYVMHS